MNKIDTTIKKGRKYDQVIEGARDIFLRDGFERASVDDIAKAAGVSKATLYSYFPDKAVLFTEVATGECVRQADETVARFDLNQPMPVILREAGTKIVDFMLSDMGQAIFRLSVSESSRFPTLAHKFYETGPKLLRDRLSKLLEMGIARGELQIEDLGLAADQFGELCKARVFPCCVFHMTDSITADDRRKVVDGAVEMFMARYGTK